jgi:hypothetical protein
VDTASDVIGVGVEAEDLYSTTIAVALDGSFITPDRVRYLDAERWVSLWRQLVDSAAVYLVVCGEDEVHWLTLRQPVPCESLKQAAALREIVRGLSHRYDILSTGD